MPSDRKSQKAFVINFGSLKIFVDIPFQFLTFVKKHYLILKYTKKSIMKNGSTPQ